MYCWKKSFDYINVSGLNEIIFTLYNTDINSKYYCMRVPIEKEFDIDWIRMQIIHQFSHIPDLNIEHIIKSFEEFYEAKYIDESNKIKEIENKYNEIKQEPFKILYRTGKIGGNGFYKDCELVLYGLNEKYFED